MSKETFTGKGSGCTFSLSEHGDPVGVMRAGLERTKGLTAGNGGKESEEQTSKKGV